MCLVTCLEGGQLLALSRDKVPMDLIQIPRAIEILKGAKHEDKNFEPEAITPSATTQDTTIVTNQVRSNMQIKEKPEKREAETTPTQAPIHTQPIEAHNAVFEPWATMHVYHHYVTLFTILKPKNFQPEIEFIDQIAGSISKLLQTRYYEECQPKPTNSSLCSALRVGEGTLAIVKSLANEIRKSNRLINNTTRRNKRGFFNGIGSMLRWVTGVTDSEKEEDVDNQLSALHLRTEKMNKMLGTSIKIIQSSSNVIATDISQATEERNKITNRLNLLGEELQNQGRDTRLVQLSEEINRLVALAALEIQEIAHQQRNTLDILNALTAATLPTAILEPEQLLKIYQNVSRGLQLGDQAQNIFTLQQIMEVFTLPVKGSIWVKIKIPLAEPLTYKLYKLYAIPTLLGPHLMSAINMPEEHVAVNNEHQRYISLTEEQVNKCKNIHSFDENIQLLCSPPNPIEMGIPSTCAARLFQNKETIPTNCLTHVGQAGPLIYRLRALNTWLVFATTREFVEVACRNQDITPIEVIGLVKIQLAASCYFTFRNQIFTASGEEHRNVTLTWHRGEAAAVKIWNTDLDDLVRSKLKISPLEISSAAATIPAWKENTLELAALREQYESEQHIQEKWNNNQRITVGCVLGGMLGILTLVIVIWVIIRLTKNKVTRRKRSSCTVDQKDGKQVGEESLMLGVKEEKQGCLPEENNEHELSITSTKTAVNTKKHATTKLPGEDKKRKMVEKPLRENHPPSTSSNIPLHRYIRTE